MIVLTGLEQARAQSAPEPFHLVDATVEDIHAAFEVGRITCRGLVERYIARIEAYDKAGPRLNAIQAVNPRARKTADDLDAVFRSTGPAGPLHCIPLLVKDQIETREMPTTFGSALFADFHTGRDATVVARLKQAGAIVLAKTTMGELGGGYFGSGAGVVKNAYDPGHQPSGSSSGTGVGIAANFAMAGIGEDTGGSVRGPAAFGSLVGLRPTVPLVSRHGMLPIQPTADTLGPMTRTVQDAALLLDVIAGYDPNDPVTAYAVGQLPDSYTTFLDRAGLQHARVGVIREPMDAQTDTTSDDYKQVKALIDKALTDLQTAGAEVIDPLTIPDLADRIKRAYEDNRFETEQAINAYLAQHDDPPVATLREIVRSGKVVPARVAKLKASLGRSPEDPGYLKILLRREALRQRVLKSMADNGLDALVYATYDHPPGPIQPDALTSPQVEDSSRRGNNRRLSSVLGFPAMTVPAGFTAEGLPVGIEFMGRPFSEAILIRLGYAFEQRTHHRRPPATTPSLHAVRSMH